MKSTRKMMTQVTIPMKSTTNGGNGGYMRRELMQKPKGGLTKPMTATANNPLREGNSYG